MFNTDENKLKDLNNNSFFGKYKMMIIFITFLLGFYYLMKFIFIK